jgi:hypothetical protein
MTQSPIRSKDRFFVFGAPAIDDAEIQDVVATIRSGWRTPVPRLNDSHAAAELLKISRIASQSAPALPRPRLNILAGRFCLVDEVTVLRGVR